jgi:hypothetical protein
MTGANDLVVVPRKYQGPTGICHSNPPDRKRSPSVIGSLPSLNLQVVKPERIQKRDQTQYTPKEAKEDQKASCGKLENRL